MQFVLWGVPTLLANQHGHSAQNDAAVGSHHSAKLEQVFSNRAERLLDERVDIGVVFAIAGRGHVAERHETSSHRVGLEQISLEGQAAGGELLVLALEAAVAGQHHHGRGFFGDTKRSKLKAKEDALSRDLLAWLAEVAGVDADAFASDFFMAGSLLASGTPEEIIDSDRKEFCEQGKDVSLSQIEELSLAAFDVRRKGLEAALGELRAARGHSLVALLVTDVKSHDSILLAVGEDKLLDALEFDRKDQHLFEAPGVVSRKKQLFPAVCRALAKAME